MRITSLLIAFLFLSAGGYSAESPMANESRPVKSATDPKKTITVPDGMVWYDASPPTRGLRFPPGTYALEAEDADYLYFRSTAPLEMRVFKNGKAVDGRTVPGGIMLSKQLLSRIPAAGYIDDEGSSKMMIWKLGKDFLHREGKDWKKSF